MLQRTFCGEAFARRDSRGEPAAFRAAQPAASIAAGKVWMLELDCGQRRLARPGRRQRRPIR